MSGSINIEDYVPVVAWNGLNTDKAVNFAGASSVALPLNTTLNGSPISSGGSPATPVVAGTVLQTVYNIRDYGAACDGSASETGTLASNGVVTDTAPSNILPVANQTFTWIGKKAAVGTAITGATQSASSAAPVITTSTAHGLATGAIVKVTGVAGAVQVNGNWKITVLSSTTFSIPLNQSSLTAYTSGGTVIPQLKISGFISNPVVVGGTLTFTAVTTSGGSTPVTVSAGADTAGTYYYGTDDIAAWNAALTAALAVTNPASPNIVTWTGTSMVSSTVIADGDVLIQGQWRDYSNPDGANSSSTIQMRGSILRPTGTFANATTKPLLQLGSTNGNTTSQLASASTRWGVFDAANICLYAIQTAGSRNWMVESVIYNGTDAALAMTSSNAVATECIVGQSNMGVGVYITGVDDKWRGGYIRQAPVGMYLNNPTDLWIGNGLHVFSGYNGGNEQFGCDILIINGGQISITDVIFDGTLGPQIRIAPTGSNNSNMISIIGCMFFQPQSMPVSQPVMELDTTPGTSSITGLILDGYHVKGSGATYKSIIESRGSGTQNKIVLGSGVATAVTNLFTTVSSGVRPTFISDTIAFYNGTASVSSGTRGLWTATGDGVATTFNLAHNLATTPNDVEFGAQNAATVGVFVTVTSTNLVFTFAVAPSNGVALAAWYRAAV